MYSQPVPWNKMVETELSAPPSLPFCSSVRLTIDQMNIRPGSGEVLVTKHREGAGVGASVPHHGVVDDQDAGDQLAGHLHSHANTGNTIYIKTKMCSSSSSNVLLKERYIFKICFYLILSSVCKSIRRASFFQVTFVICCTVAFLMRLRLMNRYKQTKKKI